MKDLTSMLPDPEDFGILFHELYKISPDNQRFVNYNNI